MKAIIDVKVTVPFTGYKNKTLNTKALQQIKRYIRKVVSINANFISLYIEKDTQGVVIEDCSKKTSSKIIKAKITK